MSPDDFPALLADERRAPAVRAAIAALIAAEAVGTIQNTVFVGAKDALNREADRVFDLLAARWFNRDTYDTTPESVQAAYWGAHATLHDVKAAAKRWAKAPDHPATAEYRALCKQLLPLALLMDRVKPLIVKRTAKSEDEKRADRAVANPNQLRLTCGFCLRDIAVLPDGTMAHHGYERPGEGWQTASCPGKDCGPWERTNAGGMLLRDMIDARLQHSEQALARLRTAKTITVSRWSSEKRKDVPVSIDASDPAFARDRRQLVESTEREIESLRRQRARVEERLVAWAPGD